DVTRRGPVAAQAQRHAGRVDDDAPARIAEDFVHGGAAGDRVDGPGGAAQPGAAGVGVIRREEDVGARAGGVRVDVEARGAADGGGDGEGGARGAREAQLHVAGVDLDGDVQRLAARPGVQQTAAVEYAVHVEGHQRRGAVGDAQVGQ